MASARARSVCLSLLTMGLLLFNQRPLRYFEKYEKSKLIAKKNKILIRLFLVQWAGQQLWAALAIGRKVTATPTPSHHCAEAGQAKCP